MDETFTKLKGLFFVLKRFLDVYHPKIAARFHKNFQINMQIIFTSWTLTLFTSVTQQTQNISLLHEMMDLIVGRGWVGFIQVSMVLIEVVGDFLRDKNFEQSLEILSTLMKENFFLIQEKIRGIKKMVNKYSLVNKRSIAFFEEEYSSMLQGVADFKENLQKKIKRYSIRNSF